jgi:hypothetical protein
VEFIAFIVNIVIYTVIGTGWLMIIRMMDQFFGRLD